MFEIGKLKKKYPLLFGYVKDRQLISKLINDSKFSEFYKEEEESISSFISALKLVYSDIEVSNIIINLIEKSSYYNFSSSINNFLKYIQYIKKYNNGNIDILIGIKWDEINKIYSGDIEKQVLALCFKKYYLKPIYINNVDILTIFLKTDSFEIKEQLLNMVKSNNLDFFASIITELQKQGINIENLDKIIDYKINENLFSEKTKAMLGEKAYNNFILRYFGNKGISFTDKKIIDRILEVENYELLSDLINNSGDYPFSRAMTESEASNDIFSLSKLKTNDIRIIINNYLSQDLRLNFRYLYYLKNSISNTTLCDELYNKHSEVLSLLERISYDTFSKLSIEEQKEIYKYIKSLDEMQKKSIIEEIKEINDEISNLYKKEYSKTFKTAESIIDKASAKQVEDSKNEKHNVNVYELKDDEEFTFLITVMNKRYRDEVLNMYGRPAHRATIEDPSNFCQDLSGGAEIISTSMINDKYIMTFSGFNADIMYLFSDVDASDIISICPEDGGYPPQIDETRELFYRTNPVSPNEFINETQSTGRNNYNEIAIRRKKSNGKKIMPSAILCFDKINDESIKHAEYFGIPIVLINTKTYKYLKNVTEYIEEENTRHI